MNMDTRDLFRDGSDLPASKPYHVKDLIQHHYVSDKVMVVQAPQLPSKNIPNPSQHNYQVKLN